jgi:3-deoxy-D-manno-octulosonic-acid transferase
MFLFGVYYLLSPFIFISLIIVSFFNTKIRTLLSYQKKSLLNIKLKLNTNKKKIVIHAASAGEYEQIKPLLKTIDKSIYFTIVTCMSPTIYSSIKEDKLSDLCCYHPFDFVWSAKSFFDIIKPSIYLTTRHDVWPIHLSVAKKNKIKTMIINANLYSKSKRLKWYSIKFSKYIFNMFDLIIVPSERISSLFKNSLKINKTHLICDSRFDQVLIRKKQSKNIPKLKSIGKNNIIFGSISWEDLEIIRTTLKSGSSNNIKENIIIVPHEIDLKLIREIKEICLETSYFNKVEMFSSLNDNSYSKVIIVDKVGILPELYGYSKFAYVGGGFGYGVHSTIEPLVYNNIVCYGPNIDLLDEAKEMEQSECGFIVNSGLEFYNKYLETLDQNKIKHIQKSINAYVIQKESAAQNIYKAINEHI